MKQNIKLLLFIKIITFILLSWICHFCNVLRTHNNYFVKCYNNLRKLYTRNYRILSKYKQHMNSNVVCLKDIPIVLKDKKDISNNAKWTVTKKEQSNGSLLRNARSHKKDMKNKTCIYETKVYSHLEKRIFKELDYVDFLNKDIAITDKLYKKIIRKKYALRLFFPVILLLLLTIAFLVEFFFGYGVVNVLYNNSILYEILNLKMLKSLQSSFQVTNSGKLFCIAVEATKEENKAGIIKNFYGSLIYILPFFILGIAIILGIFYYHKKVKKFNKIKFGKR
ncbi:hypothetical protein MKS88_003071 [Plasmodium brasilianum]|uniref:Uncharacterized protein n=1 Tax=Plasmodium brasilianum TaxID=5824 RepID=A0ACB9Y6Y2_PLABR|nr:hypothetical protein MKS88_003071 [Plasmodium brasilianum]